MSSGPRDPRAPESPDELPGGLRGNVSGVTRLGGRAGLLAFIAIGVLLAAIIYGISKPPASRQAAATATSPPMAVPTGLEEFGPAVPIVATPPPETPPPPVLEPATAVPNVAAAAPAAPVAVAPSHDDSAAEAAAAQAAAADEARRAEEARREQAALEAARRSKILIGQSGGGDSDGGGSADAASFAGNGSTSGGEPGSSSYGGNGGAGNGGAGAVRGNVAPALLGRAAPAATMQPQDTSLSYLAGPTREFAVDRANVVLPPGGNPKDFLQAQRFQPISPFEITASSVIPAALITGIDSEAPGFVTAQVREDVYDTKTGKYLLIPQGARLVGLYQSDNAYGATRVRIAWQRLIFPDTTSIDLDNMIGADTGGYGGFGGEVDNHYGKIFGAALLTSVLAAGAAIASGSENQSVLYPTVGAEISNQVGQNVLNIGATITNRALSIPPTIYVAKGYPFLVMVDRDIVLPGPYGSGL